MQTERFEHQIYFFIEQIYFFIFHVKFPKSQVGDIDDEPEEEKVLERELGIFLPE